MVRRTAWAGRAAPAADYKFVFGCATPWKSTLAFPYLYQRLSKRRAAPQRVFRKEARLSPRRAFPFAEGSFFAVGMAVFKKADYLQMSALGTRFRHDHEQETRE
jgi:hypothetical protein